MRKLIGVLRLRIDKETYKTKQTVDGKHYADWSLALILLAFYDFVIGFLSKIPSYKGSIYYLLFELTFTNGFVAGVFRFTIGVMFMVCIALALEVDD